MKTHFRSGLFGIALATALSLDDAAIAGEFAAKEFDA